MPAPADRSPLWKTLSRERLLAAPPWLEVDRERVELPGGRVIPDFYRIVLPDFVVIVPTTPSGEIVMVRGYKHALGRLNLASPAGLIEPDEKPLDAARRELFEETGYESDDWTVLGQFVVDGNRGCGTMHLFAARDVHYARPPIEDEAEDLAVELMSRSRVVESIRSGEVGNLAGAGPLAIALMLGL